MSTLRASVCKKLGLSATASQTDVYRAALKKIGKFSSEVKPWMAVGARVRDTVGHETGVIVEVRRDRRIDGVKVKWDTPGNPVAWADPDYLEQAR